MKCGDPSELDVVRFVVQPLSNYERHELWLKTKAEFEVQLLGTARLKTNVLTGYLSGQLANHACGDALSPV